MTCDGCAKDITGALHKLPGITNVEASVKDQMVSVEGTGMACCIQLRRRHLCPSYGSSADLET